MWYVLYTYKYYNIYKILFNILFYYAQAQIFGVYLQQFHRNKNRVEKTGQYTDRAFINTLL